VPKQAKIVIVALTSSYSSVRFCLCANLADICQHSHLGVPLRIDYFLFTIDYWKGNRDSNSI